MKAEMGSFSFLTNRGWEGGKEEGTLDPIRLIQVLTLLVSLSFSLSSVAQAQGKRCQKLALSRWGRE